jgi:hypothetical protein
MHAIGRTQQQEMQNVLGRNPRRGGGRDHHAYATARGLTQLSASVPPAEFAAPMQRFVEAAIKVFTWTDAIVDEMAGDKVNGIDMPCGREH